MTQYRRHFQPGGSYFFTVNLAERQLRLLTGEVEVLCAAFRYTAGAASLHAGRPITHRAAGMDALGLLRQPNLSSCRSRLTTWQTALSNGSHVTLGQGAAS